MRIDPRGWLATLLSVVGIVAIFVVPEGRRFIGLDAYESSVPPATMASSVATVTVMEPPPNPVLTPSVEPIVTSEPEPEPIPDSYHHNHRKKYTGQVWIHITPAPGNEGKRHAIHIVWGSAERKGTFWIEESLSLLHDKTKPDSITMDVHVDPAAMVEFGEGAPPRGETEKIHKGWTKRA